MPVTLTVAENNELGMHWLRAPAAGSPSYLLYEQSVIAICCGLSYQ